MFTHGLVIGKFYPPHHGHKYLIDTAVARSKDVTVIVCWKEGQTISGIKRAQWIQAIHPTVHVKLLDDNRLTDDDSAGWAKNTLTILGFAPDAVFTSEAYGDAYASYMGCIHVLVDKERTHIPISATLVRSDPIKYAAFLEPNVQAYFAKRVCIVGAESTGTTTLAEDLARHYNTVWVPEYGRFYSAGKLHGDVHAVWRSEEFTYIAEAQAKLEDTLTESSNGLIICDTDPFATSIWHERYMGERSAVVEKIANSRHYDLYLLTGDEIPFVHDGLRDGEHIRHDMHKTFVSRLTESKRPFILMTGSREERLTKAIQIIDKVILYRK